ncbi:MAG: hypothetical protein QG597_2897 [Actinomycetota bacterium]|nr:hypothetical protein [Actinomycetota bacterium]
MVFGSITYAHAKSLVGGLSTSGDPGYPPDVPWMALAILEGGRSVAVSCSTLLQNGLYWATEPGASRNRLVVGTDPGSVAKQLFQVSLNVDHLFKSALLEPSTATPFREIHRLRLGQTLLFDTLGGPTRILDWCGPSHWSNVDAPDVGHVREYVEAFDRVVADSLTRTQEVVVCASSGLDSTYLLASLARRLGGSEVAHGYVHAPLPGARLRRPDGTAADEYPLASLMESRYPSRVRIRAVRNFDSVKPLDAALQLSSLSWEPMLAVSNAIWISQIWDIACRHDSKFLYHGRHGNASFSGPHPYALDYYLANRRPAAALRVSFQRPHALRTWLSASRNHLGFGGRPAAKIQTDEQCSAVRVVDGSRVGWRLDTAAYDREAFLRELGLRRSRVASLPYPRGVLPVDPFRARAILELASRIPPIDWTRGPLGWRGYRGFARRVGKGRVPDPIRLARAGDSQGQDAWFAMRDQKTQYLSFVEALRDCPVFGDAIDHRHISQVVRDWPWGEAQSPPTQEFAMVNQVLHVSQFVSLLRNEFPQLSVGGS